MYTSLFHRKSIQICFNIKVVKLRKYIDRKKMLLLKTELVLNPLHEAKSKRID